MSNRTKLGRWYRIRTAGLSGLLALATIGGLANSTTPAADLPANPTPAAASIPAPGQTLGLQECIQLALSRQPRLAILRASLAAAEDGSRALESLHIPTCLARDLPIRRRQAELGVLAASVGLQQAEQVAIYAVTRSYYTVIYAREQERIARSVVERLGVIQEAGQKALEGGARDVAATDVDRSTIYLELAQARSLQATEGVARGLSALKEAIGLTDCSIEVPAGTLPQPAFHLDRNELVALALARRGELVQASTFAQATSLEVEAQQTSCRARMNTFASGAHINAQVPQDNFGTEYRPGAEPPEMPTILVGSRNERTKRALSLNERALAVTEKTRGLITLETEDAFNRWEAAVRKIPHTRKGAESGQRFADSLEKGFSSGLKVRPEEVISAQVLAAQALSQHYEVLFQQVVALADLERVTGGGFCAGLASQTAVVIKTVPKKKTAKTIKPQ